MRKYNIIVSGAGMVGASAALALARHGASVAIVDAGNFDSVKPGGDDSYDLRVSAISPRSANFLKQLDVWNQLERGRIRAYEKMFIWHQTGNASVSMDSSEVGLNSLGSIIENSQILSALINQCQNHTGIEMFKQEQIQAIDDNSETGLKIRLGSSLQISGDLLLVAEGRDSHTRAMAGINSSAGQYEQKAIVANVSTEKSHQNTAWQRFLTSGPLALLPLANGQTSIVWSADNDFAEFLMSLSDEDFCLELNSYSNEKLGLVTSTSKRASFPLNWHSCDKWINSRAIVIGDSAHGVHPLAGQGVNLGFSDVEELVAAIPEPEKPWQMRHLRRFERRRISETYLAMQSFTALKNLYGSNLPTVGAFRDFGMQAVGKIKPLKRYLIEQAVGNMS